MSAAALTSPRERPGPARERRAVPGRKAVRLFEPGRPTLDDRISALWSDWSRTGAWTAPSAEPRSRRGASAAAVAPS